MERASSAPAIRLSNEDYKVPCHGIGLTGPEKKTLLGSFYKDKGEFSSRLGMIIKEAKKTPGPGKYIGHTQWVQPDRTSGSRNIYETVTRFGNKFETSSRSFKPARQQIPAPNHYEDKGVNLGRPNDCKEIQSKRLRTKLGKASKGPKRNFLDSVIECSKGSPAPGQYHKADGQVLRNRLELHHGAPDMSLKHTASKKAAAAAGIAPNHYNPQYQQAEEKPPCYSCPKAIGNNFVDKVVRSHMLDKKTPMPSPGQHNLISPNLVSRGTKQLTVGGLGRGACSGYF